VISVLRKCYVTVTTTVPTDSNYVNTVSTLQELFLTTNSQEYRQKPASGHTEALVIGGLKNNLELVILVFRND
jgi:hypothetical protein